MSYPGRVRAARDAWYAAMAAVTETEGPRRLLAAQRAEAAARVLYFEEAERLGPDERHGEIDAASAEFA